VTGDNCAEWRLLVQADLDGELGPAESARVAAHLDGCASCTDFQGKLLAISATTRREAAYRPAPAALRTAIQAQLAATVPPRVPERRRVTWRPVLPFGAGFALAACLAIAVLLPRSGDDPPATIVADHIRALQPGHLMDVVSTDQHTVKPWFDGRLDFAPPVKDFKQAGFPLVGGRLDYLDSRPVAALVYQHGKHVIDVYVWPGKTSPAQGTLNGYNYVRWAQDGMVFWAVSDLASPDLAKFTALWPGP
jgi:anti-sigma factor RsiW